jgi:hypothetical protein
MKLRLAAAHRVDDDILVLEGGCAARIKLFYQKLERKRLKVGALRREACYAATQCVVQIRRGGDDTNVIFRQSGW